jgi:hypothetical protein
MWPFHKKPTQITSEEFAVALMPFIVERSREFCTTLQKKTEQTWSLEPHEIEILKREILVANLWAASKALGPDRRVLDALHDHYFRSWYRSGKGHEEGAAQANAAQAELLKRYNTYYKALGPEMTGDSWMQLGFEMSQVFFPKRKPVLNARISSYISMHVQIIMRSLLTARGKYQLKDA